MSSRTLATWATAALLLAGTACNTPTRHAALTFFFDGVPPLETPPPPGQAVAEAGAGPERFFREHGPYGAKLCSSCHESTASNSFVAPRDQLCVHCHSFEPKKKFEHDPSASGDCMSCHDPHSSAYRYLLVASPNAVCAECHEKETLPEDESHTNSAKACVGCHDPHQSDKEYLLR